MPTVLRVGGFTFRIWPGDHMPAHVHVFKAGGEIVVELEPIRVREIWGLSSRDAVKAVRIAEDHQEMLLAAWRTLHG